MIEQWVPIPLDDYAGLYEISNEGRVRSFWRKMPRILKSSLMSTGRLGVSLVSRESVKKTWAIHQLVALGFLGPCPKGHEVRHLDGNHLNNSLSNLKYGTRSENRIDSVHHGTHHNTRKTHCPQGHEYIWDNIYSRPGSSERQCKRCLSGERPLPKCSREECSSPVKARGLCMNHYGQWYRQQPGVLVKVAERQRRYQQRKKGE